MLYREVQRRVMGHNGGYIVAIEVFATLDRRYFAPAYNIEQFVPERPVCYYGM
jgi:hypothetical protein